MNPAADQLSEDTIVTVVPMTAVEARSGRIDTSRREPWGRTRKGLRPVRNGDVLFAKITPSMENGKIAVARGLANEHGVASTEFHVIRPGPLLDARFLVHLLQTPTVRNAARRNMKGTVGQLRVPAAYLGQLPLRVPTLEVQRQLADCLDAASSQLREGRENLDALVAKVGALRRAILDEYWSGRASTESGKTTIAHRDVVRDNGGGRRSSSSSYPSSRLSLPDDWGSRTIAELISDADYGTSEKCDYGFKGPPVVRIPNVIDGHVDLSDLKYAHDLFQPKAADALGPGDLLVVRTNGSRGLIGRAALVETPLATAHYHASYLIRLRFPNLALARWIALLWDAPAVRNVIVGSAATSAGQYNVSLRELTGIRMPIPPEPEMKLLTEALRARIDGLASLRSNIQVAIPRASRLRDSATEALLGRFVR